eukprot:92456-Heterocapsa_arctica.AAC.2
MISPICAAPLNLSQTTPPSSQDGQESQKAGSIRTYSWAQVLAPPNSVPAGRVELIDKLTDDQNAGFHLRSGIPQGIPTKENLTLLVSTTKSGSGQERQHKKP